METMGFASRSRSARQAHAGTDRGLSRSISARQRRQRPRPDLPRASAQGLGVAKVDAALAGDIRIAVDGRAKRRLEIGRDVPGNAEIKRLFDATAGQPKMRARLLIAAFTGLRASELRGFRWYASISRTANCTCGSGRIVRPSAVRSRRPAGAPSRSIPTS